MTAPVGPPVRVALAIHATGFLSLGLAPMLAVAILLFGSAIEAAPFLIGVAVAARSLLSLFLSIHGGVLMERLGTRPIMLLFALVITAVAPLYPVLPWIGAIIGLQLVMGLAQAM